MRRHERRLWGLALKLGPAGHKEGGPNKRREGWEDPGNGQDSVRWPRAWLI